MLRFAPWKALLVFLICTLGFLGSLPVFMGQDAANRLLPSWWASRQLTLGLDLSGGSHLLLEVKHKELFKEQYALFLSRLRKALREKKIGYQRLSSTGEGLTFKLRDQADAPSLTTIVRELDRELDYTVQDQRVQVFFSHTARQEILKNAVDKSVEIIRSRVDETGTKEPLIQPQGSDRILLQLPGVDDPDHVRELIGKTARLSFHLVEDIVSSDESSPLPPHTEHLSGAEDKKVSYIVQKEPLLTGEMLIDARPSFDQQYNRPQVAFSFNRTGAALFAEVTRTHTGRPFAIVLDHRVISAPNINEPILTGSGVIHGNFSIQEAQDLALLMRSGALPAPLEVLEQRTIGPGLGVDSISQGTTSTIISVLLVALCIFLIYSAFSFFANIAIVLNIMLLIVGLIFLNATLTLPGIAGIALTLGMAVDANVLINERIKEERKRGKKIIAAIDAGYRRALQTIIDSNVTTLIGAAILYYFGTGPIRGFAVTLALGVIISMFTAITFTRALVSLWVAWKRPKTLWI